MQHGGDVSAHVVFPEPTSLGSAAHFVSSLCEQADAAQFDEVVESGFGLAPGVRIEQLVGMGGVSKGSRVRAK